LVLGLLDSPLDLAKRVEVFRDLRAVRWTKRGLEATHVSVQHVENAARATIERETGRRIRDRFVIPEGAH
jgi:hypothetical protein